MANSRFLQCAISLQQESRALIPLHFGIGQARNGGVGVVHKFSLWGPVGPCDVVENLQPFE